MRSRGFDVGDSVPGWLSALAPALAVDEVAEAAEAWSKCGEDLKRRAQLFLRQSFGGVQCRLADKDMKVVYPAHYSLDVGCSNLSMQAPTHMEVEAVTHLSPVLRQTVALADIRNIWVCLDSELARRARVSLSAVARNVEASCLMLIDAPIGPICLLERNFEARETFLDAMMVLIATQRLRREPDLACCKLSKGVPPPEAKLRPSGGSLQSAHISGPICGWLARLCEDVLPFKEVPEAFPRTSADVQPRAAALQQRPAKGHRSEIVRKPASDCVVVAVSQGVFVESAPSSASAEDVP